MTNLIHFIVTRNLETLTLGRGQLGETFFQGLTDCHVLKNLTINDATLGNGIQEIPIYHDSLRVLQLVKCRVLRVSIRLYNVGPQCYIVKVVIVQLCLIVVILTDVRNLKLCHLSEVACHMRCLIALFYMTLI